MPKSPCPLYPKSGHVQCNQGCPLCAKSGHQTALQPGLRVLWRCKGANQSNTPARQLDSTPAVALISLRGADRLGVPINLSALSMWNFKFHGALSLALTCGLHEAREGRPGCRYRELL